MTTHSIYIHLIDGTDVWVLIQAKHVQNNQFEIIETNEYTVSATKGLFQFFPGDVVELDEHVLSDGSKRHVAKKLVSKGQWPDRKFNEFKYKAMLKQVSIDKEAVKEFEVEIKRIKAEYSKGQIFYPTLMETVNKLDAFR